MPDAIRAARTRRVFQHPKHVAVIKDAIALPYARSLDVLERADEIWQQGLAQARAAVLADQAVAEEIANGRLAHTRARYRNGAGGWLRGVGVLEASRRMAATARLEIIRRQR